MNLVCPICGGDNLGTREKAEIWQRAFFTVASPVDEPDIEWWAYDSGDVGETETIGYFCKDCVVTWDGLDIPFITEEEFLAEREELEEDEERWVD